MNSSKIYLKDGSIDLFLQFNRTEIVSGMFFFKALCQHSALSHYYPSMVTGSKAENVGADAGVFVDVVMGRVEVLF